jgi:hypothetical protein
MFLEGFVGIIVIWWELGVSVRLTGCSFVGIIVIWWELGVSVRLTGCSFVHHGSHVDNYQFQSRCASWEAGSCWASGIVQPPLNAICSITLIWILCVQLFDIVLVRVTRESITSSIGDWQHFSREFQSHAGYLRLILRRLRKATESYSLFLYVHVLYIRPRWITRRPPGGFLLDFVSGDFN